MSDFHEGSCLCGSVAYEVAGSFKAFYLCHCSRCQKDSGSAHAANLFAPGARLTWIKGAEGVTTYRHEGTLHTRSFCQSCGSAMPVEMSEINALVVPAGSLNTKVPIAATARIYMADAAHWVSAIQATPEFPALP
ncbi:GFA family protein [Thalassolituus sp.]|uniref:GFA family protein n=1 Tax=Thalassolituus sp. TaxID=2030822 RepID=UPI003517DCE3